MASGYKWKNKRSPHHKAVTLPGITLLPGSNYLKMTGIIDATGDEWAAKWWDGRYKLWVNGAEIPGSYAKKLDMLNALLTQDYTETFSWVGKG